MLYFIGWLVFLLFFKAYLNYKVVGRENIPKKGAFILAANHSSFLDPVLLGTACHRSLNYMAREDLFSNRYFGWALRKVHVFPVKRNEGDFRAIKESLKKLKEDKPLVIFPEGTRSKDGNLMKGKPGIGFIARKVGVPVVPAYIKGAFEALPGGVDSLRRHPVKVYIGPPIDFGRNHLNTKDRDVYQAMSDEIMRKICELKELYESKTC